MANSTKKRSTRKAAKPQKPYPDFPLFLHATGRWAKKIRGKLHYLGKIADDPEGTKVLAKLNSDLPHLKEGRTSPPADTREGVTFRTLCNKFLNSKRQSLEAGELTEAMFADYLKTTDKLIAHFGADRRIDDLRPDDFEKLRVSMAKKWG